MKVIFWRQFAVEQRGHSSTSSESSPTSADVFPIAGDVDPITMGLPSVGVPTTREEKADISSPIHHVHVDVLFACKQDLLISWVVFTPEENVGSCACPWDILDYTCGR